MEVEQAVKQAISTFVENSGADDVEIVKILADSGFNDVEACELAFFVPLALGRALLDGFGPKFSDEFVYVDEKGRPVSRGTLDDEPVFVATMQAARLNSDKEVIKVVGPRSSEVHAINAALKDGSKPEDLVLNPVAMSHPDVFRRMRTAPAPKWWQFWK